LISYKISDYDNLKIHAYLLMNSCLCFHHFMPTFLSKHAGFFQHPYYHCWNPHLRS